jgi:hypothetical protein
MMAVFAFLLVPESGCGHGIFPEVSPSATATIVPTFTITSSPSATPTAVSALRPFSMIGSGTQSSPGIGTCSGQTCNATGHACTCLKFSGTLEASLIGQSQWDASVTVNSADCENTGTPSGFCCIGDGVLNLTSGTGSAANMIGMTITASVCDNPDASNDLSLAGNFKILPSSSAGKFAHAAGTGRINAFSASSNGATYINASGTIQLSSPL